MSSRSARVALRGQQTTYQTHISILLSIPRNGFGPSSKSTHLAHLVTAAFVTRVDMAFTLPVGGAVAIRFAVDLRGTSEFDP